MWQGKSPQALSGTEGSAGLVPPRHGSRGSAWRVTIRVGVAGAVSFGSVGMVRHGAVSQARLGSVRHGAARTGFAGMVGIVRAWIGVAPHCRSGKVPKARKRAGRHRRFGWAGHAIARQGQGRNGWRVHEGTGAARSGTVSQTWHVVVGFVQAGSCRCGQKRKERRGMSRRGSAGRTRCGTVRLAAARLGSFRTRRNGKAWIGVARIRRLGLQG